MLIQFLNERVAFTQRRIREATGVDVDVIYYAAGYKAGDSQQYPWNLSKLLAYIIQHTKEEKRAVIVWDTNRNEEVWEDDNELLDYISKVKDFVMESVVKNIIDGVSSFSKTIIKAAVKVVSGAISTIGSWFGF